MLPDNILQHQTRAVFFVHVPVQLHEMRCCPCPFLYLDVGVRVCQSHLPKNKCQELLIQITRGEDVGDGKQVTAKEMPGLHKDSHVTTSCSMKHMQRRRHQHYFMAANGAPH